MRRGDAPPLWERLRAGEPAGRFVADGQERLELTALVERSVLGPALPKLSGASVLIWSVRQLPAARALLELDGVARRILLCPPDIAAEHLPAIAAEAEVDAVVADGAAPACGAPVVSMGDFAAQAIGRGRETEWVLFTSGTTGRPKLAAHTLRSLAGPIAEGPQAAGAVWSTFYDTRRYGGLQILLRALAGGGSMVFGEAGEAADPFLRRAAAAGVTHLLGTPTHWRRALMSPALASLALRYVRLSGEIADQAVLDRLAAAFPGAGLTHAYASTEAGVGFEVTDGLAGFPPEALGARADRAFRVVDGTLRVRSERAARGYLSGAGLADAEGFIDTDDLVEERAGRFHFVGRRSGVLNVGGEKVQPEAVEAVILRHAAVRFARVSGRASPVTGTLLQAEIVLAEGAFAAVRGEVLALCRAALGPAAVPALWREVDALPVSAAGKLDRRA